jgi:hypothetical protein
MGCDRRMCSDLGLLDTGMKERDWNIDLLVAIEEAV